MPHATFPSPGLQAVILCGPGVSLNTFTSNPKDLPKALIPIANRPMVWYPLDWCYRMGVTDITLITPPESSSPLEAALATNPSLTSLPSPKPEILAPVDLNQTTGTAEILRLPEVQDAMTSDFIILPCDLISELDGTALLHQWLNLNPLTTSNGKRKGGLALFYPTQGREGISTKKDETDFLATVHLSSPPVPPPPSSLRSNMEEIVMSMPTDTLNDKVEEDKGFLRLRQSLLERHGRVKMRMRHRDAHVYVFPKWVKEFVTLNENFDSVSEDVLGWWAKAGWQGSDLAEKLGLPEALAGEKRQEDDEMDGAEEVEEVDAAALSTTKSARPAQQAPSTGFASRVGTSAPSLKPSTPVPPLLAYVQPTLSPQSSHHSSLIRRIDTGPQLLAISLYLAKQPTDHILSHEHKLHPTATLEQQSRVSQDDSLIAENVKVGFRSNIKESVVGANCEVGKNVRLTRCLLMEGVVVGDGVQMMGCIVGRRARIEGTKAPVERPTTPTTAAVGEGESSKARQKKKKGGADNEEEERTKLTDCEVAPKFIVEGGTEAKGEKLMAFDTEGDMDEEEFEEEEEGEEEEEED